MQQTLKRKLTGSMLLTVAAAMVIVSVCLLFGMARYSAAQFSRDIAEVFTTDVLTEMNASATDSPESAAIALEQTVDANAGRLRIGAGREYSIWDAETGNCIGGSQENAAVTDNIITAMNGTVGQAVSLLPAQMDIAIPVTGDVALVIDIVDDGSAMRTLLWNVLMLLLVAVVLSLLACAVLSHILAGAFAGSAAQTAQEIRQRANQDDMPEGDWEAMAVALYRPEPKHRRVSLNALQKIVPYLQDGYVRFTLENGIVLEINEAARNLLKIAPDTDDLTFAQIFPGVPMPDETQGMVHGQFTHAGKRIDVVFLALGDDTFAGILHAIDEGCAV